MGRVKWSKGGLIPSLRLSACFPVYSVSNWRLEVLFIIRFFDLIFLSS